MYPNSMLFGAIFAAIFAIEIILSTIVAIKRGFLPALIRLATIVASFILALILAPMIATKLSGLSETLANSMFGDMVVQIEQFSPSTIDLLYHFPIALLAPTLFISLFYIFKSLTLLLFRILKPTLPSHTKLSMRILGGLSGALGAVITLCAVLLPIWGMLGICHRAAVTLSQAETSENESLSEAVFKLERFDSEILGPVVNNFVADIFTDSGDNALYRSMTKFELHDEHLQLSEEIDLLAVTAADAFTFVGSMPPGFELSNLSDEQFEYLHTLTSDVDHSTLLRNICAEWISSVSGTWESGQPFMGVPEPQTNDSIRPVIRAFYGLLATTNESCLAGDIDSFINILEIFIRHNLLDTSQEENLLSLLGNRAFTDDLITFLAEHDRIRATFTEFISSMMTAWEKGEAHEGLPAPQTNELIDPVLKAFFHVFATTNEDLIVSDMSALADIIGVLKDYDIFNSVQDGRAMAKIVMDGQFMADLNAAVNNNERFMPVLDTVTSIGLSAISGQLNISLPNSAAMTDIASAISNALNNSQGEEAVVAAVEQALKKNNVDVPESISQIVAQVSISEFGNAQSVSENEVSDYLNGLYHSTDDLDGFFK